MVLCALATSRPARCWAGWQGTRIRWRRWRSHRTWPLSWSAPGWTAGCRYGTLPLLIHAAPARTPRVLWQWHAIHLHHSSSQAAWMACCGSGICARDNAQPPAPDTVRGFSVWPSAPMASSPSLDQMMAQPEYSASLPHSYRDPHTSCEFD